METEKEPWTTLFGVFITRTNRRAFLGLVEKVFNWLTFRHTPKSLEKKLLFHAEYYEIDYMACVHCIQLTHHKFCGFYS